MYISAWPSLNPVSLVKRSTAYAPFPLASPANSYFYVARNGIYHLMRSLQHQGRQVVLAPDYHHGNEIYAMKAAGAELRYYRIKRNLDVDLDSIADLCHVEPRPHVLYLTHFIGWPQPMTKIQALCREKNLILIEDCALSFMSDVEGKPLGGFGSYSVFCLYKTLPLPNGAVLVANKDALVNQLSVDPCSLMSAAGPTVDLVLRWIRSRYETCGRALVALKGAAGRALTSMKVSRVPVGNTGFDISTANIGMSPICHSLLRRFEFELIKERRRRNFRAMTDRLRGNVAVLEKRLSEGVCPLFFPLIARDKEVASTALAERGIETIQFWNSGDPESCRKGSDAEFLRRHLLEVPIHQDLTLDAVEYTAEQILRLRLGMTT